ncbi:MAG TPA: methyltransferase domain-containing protein [Pyrinomonadaceae bacterium]
MSSVQINDTLREWRETAQFWAKHHDTIRTMFAPVTRELIERAQISEGQNVLDVAGGAGEPSLTIAATVGGKGSVTCTDAVKEMVDAAQAEALKRGITNVQFRQCTADSLPFADESFDVGVSRLGVMFFPEPVESCRELLRVIKRDGILGFAVWAKSELNPFSYVVTNVMSRHVETPPADPDAPGAFRFAELGKLAKVMLQAGASDIEERVFKFHIEAPISVTEFWAMRSQTSETLREKLSRIPESERRQIDAEVEEAVREFFPNNQMKFPAQMIIVTGQKGR